MCTHKFTDIAIPNRKLSQLCEQIFTNYNFILISHHIIMQGKRNYTNTYTMYTWYVRVYWGKMILLTFTYLMYVCSTFLVVASNDCDIPKKM